MKKRKNYPRTIRGAERRGYTIVDVPADFHTKFKVSWLGVCIWTERWSKAHYVDNFMQRKMAFENSDDAAMFILKWC